MEPLTKWLVALLDLAEAELRTLKSGVVRLGLHLVMIVVAGVFGVLGTVCVLAAAYLVLERLTNRPTALAISGVVFLAAAGILGVMAFGKKNAEPPATPTTPESVKPDDPVGMRIAS